MTKHRRYYLGDPRNQRRRRRKWVLAAIIVTLVAIAIWRTTDHKSPPDQVVASSTSPATTPDEPIMLSAVRPDERRGATQEIPAAKVEPVLKSPGHPVEEVSTESPEPTTPAVTVVDTYADSPARKWYQEGRRAMDAGDIVRARRQLTQAVKTGELDPVRENQARLLLNRAAGQWLLSRNIFENDPHCDLYKVKSGDRLSKIGAEHKVPYQLLMRINGIEDATKLQAGESIKVVNGPFHAKVSRNGFALSVYLQDILVYTWPVGLGSPGRQTPKGKWMVQVGKKQINPAWWDREEGKHYLPDDPKNPLGERWIGLQGKEGEAVGRDGFGIHGTIRPEEIKKAVSRGCIRLYNKDVAILYDLLAEGQSFVWVED